MAMVLDAFVNLFVEKLAALAQDEIVMLLGVSDSLEKLRGTLRMMKDVLIDAESKKISDKSVSNWLARLRDIMYDADDLFDDCRMEAEKHDGGGVAFGGGGSKWYHSLSFFSCCCSVAFQHEIGTRIQGINSDLENLWKEVQMLKLVAILPERCQATSNPTHSEYRETFSQIIDSDIVGLDRDTGDFVDKLMEQSPIKCPVFAITGMPGIGKTTLAQKVFNDHRIKLHFEDIMWIYVSKKYRDTDLLREIANCLCRSKEGKGYEKTGEGKAQPDVPISEKTTKAQLATEVSKLVKGKRILLVLDDIWNARVWVDVLRIPLKDAANGSRVLVTTRDEGVSNGMKAVFTHHPKILLEKEGWLMLRKVVFREDEEHEAKKFKIKGMAIVKKCKGLPLTIKAIGGVLRKDGSSHAWERVLNSQTWNFSDLHKEVVPGLLLSYEDLPSHLKQCFIYCSLFPEDFKFHQPNLVQMWIAEGFVKADGIVLLEEVGDGYYRELVMRNFLQAVPDYYDGLGCKMHDLVRSLGLYVSQNEYINEDPEGSKSSSVKLRHMSYVKKDASVVPEINESKECLRTLLLSRNPFIKEIPAEYFDKLRRLRVLDLTYTGIENLPDTLGNLVHLRFLSMSFTKLKRLPESIKNLRNLETLRANGSKFLRSLPQGVSELQNLRHLTVGATDTQLDCMPTGMDKLRKLRTCHGFVVNGSSGTEENKCNLQELSNLSELTDLSIFKVERVVGKAEAEEAILMNKNRLRYLRLSCTRRPKKFQSEETQIKNMEEVFEGLNPPQNLDKLHIEGFFGRTMPTWITSCSFHDLTWLRLDDCKQVKQLPPLGLLPELRVLHVWGATAVSEVDSDFLGGLLDSPSCRIFLFGE